MDINVLLFDGFETLDVSGPVEILGQLPEFRLRFVSKEGGPVRSVQGMEVVTEPVGAADRTGILLVPGGMGTRRLVKDRAFLALLHELSAEAETCLSVCTGSALLAACHALDGRRATSNKKAFDWVSSVDGQVDWVRRARWVSEGKYYTSSGISAGMDMALGFVSDRFGRERAEAIATHIEYLWNDDCTADPFAGEA